jgi:hypothetical protein
MSVVADVLEPPITAASSRTRTPSIGSPVSRSVTVPESVVPRPTTICTPRERCPLETVIDLLLAGGRPTTDADRTYFPGDSLSSSNCPVGSSNFF